MGKRIVQRPNSAQTYTDMYAAQAAGLLLGAGYHGRDHAEKRHAVRVVWSCHRLHASPSETFGRVSRLLSGGRPAAASQHPSCLHPCYPGRPVWGAGQPSQRVRLSEDALFSCSTTAPPSWPLSDEHRAIRATQVSRPTPRADLDASPRVTFLQWSHNKHSVTERDPIGQHGVPTTAASGAHCTARPLSSASVVEL